MKKLLFFLLALSLALVLCAVPATADEAYTIKDDTLYFNGHSYRLFNDASSWNGACSNCSILGAHLATISSQEENEALFNFMKAYGISSAYFGLTDEGTEGTWVWENYEPIAFTNWHDGEPNGENSREDYAMFYYKFTNGEWNDGDFGGSTVNGGTYYFCEWDYENNDLSLPNAVRYVPYYFQFNASISGPYTDFMLQDGHLPEGLELSSDGVISGIPKELGVFPILVMEFFNDNLVIHKSTITCIYQGAADVEQFNVSGYGFVETASDDGRMDDQAVTSVEELTDQTTHLEGAYSEFQALYLDAQELTRDVDYTAEEGSTVITVLEDTLARAGSGTHVLAAEFERRSGGSSETVYTVQNFTLSGIGGKNVNVTVKGTPIVWWDAEPYIDGNNRTMCPFRIIGEALGLTAGWDGETREAYFTDGSRTIYFPIDGKTARTSEGGAVQMDTAAVIVNGRTYAPVRYLAEYFGYTVGWDGKTQTVSVE